MTSIGGDGPLCIAVMWSLTMVVFVFLIIRVYTRMLFKTYGMDDHFFLLTIILTVLYSAMATVAVTHGYGRSDLTPAEQADATYWRMIAQTFSLVATATSKACVGFFLLRLAVVRWQRISVWAIMGVMGFLGIINSFFTWLACKPLSYAFDERLDGTCFDTKYPAIMMAMGTIAVDLYFAILPWIFIWKLNLPRREKFTIAGSLSLGFLAAVAGGIRVLNVKGVRDVPVPVIVWSQVETCLTLICVAIPVCRQLWSRQISKWYQSHRGSSYERQSEQPNDHSGRIGLHTIGGSPMDGSKEASKGRDGSRKKHGVWSNVISIVRSEHATEQRSQNDTDSDEIVLTSRDPAHDPSAGPKSKNAWALGQQMTETRAERQMTTDDEGLQNVQRDSGIVAKKTYSITRS